MHEMATDTLYQRFRSGELATIFSLLHPKTYLATYQLLLQHAQVEKVNKTKDKEAAKKFLALPPPSYPQDRKRNNNGRAEGSKTSGCPDKRNHSYDWCSSPGRVIKHLSHTPPTSPREQVLLAIQIALGFTCPKPSKYPTKNKYCKHHRDHEHTTKDFFELKK